MLIDDAPEIVALSINVRTSLPVSMRTNAITERALQLPVGRTYTRSSEGLLATSGIVRGTTAPFSTMGTRIVW